MLETTSWNNPKEQTRSRHRWVVCEWFAWLSPHSIGFQSWRRKARCRLERNLRHCRQWCQICDTKQWEDLGPFVLPEHHYLLCLWTLLLSSQTHFSIKLTPTKGHEWAHDLIIITVSLPLMNQLLFQSYAFTHRFIASLSCLSFPYHYFFLRKHYRFPNNFFKLQLQPDNHLTNLMQSYHPLCGSSSMHVKE